jgi:hypothetical protein
MKTAMVAVFLGVVSMAYAQQESKQESPAEHHCSMVKHDEMVKHDDMMKHDEMVKHDEMMKHGQMMNHEEMMKHGETMKHDEMEKHEEMMKHGDMAMGFSQTKTTHHFHLSASGGVIEVQTNDASDTAIRDQIQHHLREISKSFAAGDFSSPMLTHGKIPPGVPDMQRLQADLSYSYVALEHGGKVLISTANSEALKAVHEFLRFQIEEHQTGDSEIVQK